MITNDQKRDPNPTSAREPIATMEGEGGGVVTSAEATLEEAISQHSTRTPNQGPLESRNKDARTENKP
jgi:hypothetical protein